MAGYFHSAAAIRFGSVAGLYAFVENSSNAASALAEYMREGPPPM